MPDDDADNADTHHLECGVYLTRMAEKRKAEGDEEEAAPKADEES